MYVKAKITSKYQITLPKDLREKLGVKEGDRVVFEGNEEKVLMRAEKKMDPVAAIEGILEGQKPGQLKQKAASRMLKRKLGL